MNSIWNQTCRDYEVVVAYSTMTAVPSMIGSAMAPDGVRTALAHLHKGTVGEVFNAAAKIATGRFLALLEDGDEFAADRLDVFRRAIHFSPDTPWGFSGVDPVDRLGRNLESSDVPAQVRLTIERSKQPILGSEEILNINPAVTCGNLVVDARVFERLGGFGQLRHAFGWDLVIRLLATSKPMAIERPLYRCRLVGSMKAAETDKSSEASVETEVHAMLARNRELLHVMSWSASGGMQAPISPFGDLDYGGRLAALVALRAYRTIRGIRPLNVVLKFAAKVLVSIR